MKLNDLKNKLMQRFSGKAENETRRRLYYYTALYSDTDGEIALREYEINGDANDLANWQPTGNWWNIDYSVNKVSETRFVP
jgi:hypothetical protein